MREFDTAKRDGRVRKRLEPGHRRAAPLDCAVVLLDDIVEILVRPDLHIAPAGVLTSQQPQRASTRRVAVERHLARDARKCRGERLAKERLCGRNAAVTAKQKVDGLAVFVDCPIRVMPLPPLSRYTSHPPQGHRIDYRILFARGAEGRSHQNHNSTVNIATATAARSSGRAFLRYKNSFW